MSNQTFTKLKYVNLFTADPPKSLSERIKSSKLFLLLLKFFHIRLKESIGTLYSHHAVEFEIFEILLELSTESLTDHEKYQQASERYYLLGILSGHQWSLDWLLQKSRFDQITCIGRVLAQYSKFFDISTVEQALSRKPCERPKLDSQLLNAQETWKSLPHLWY